MLGHLLPVLLTSLMHPNLQTLTLADALMPQLVQLVLYTSQVGLMNMTFIKFIKLNIFLLRRKISHHDDE